MASVAVTPSEQAFVSHITWNNVYGINIPDLASGKNDQSRAGCHPGMASHLEKAWLS